ncbi:MAG TPA: C-type lectin domain-containing protein [Kofleriaceae bacterium]
MRGLLLLVLIAGTAGCLRTTEFRCATSADCAGTGGVCEVTKYCSFADTDCPNGQRYGDYAGTYSNKCVGELPMIDGGMDDSLIDTPPGGCPTTYATLPNAGPNVYKLTTGSAQWATQRDRCAADNAYLAIPDGMAELQAITTAGAAAKTWVGISDIQTEGTYRTVKNMPATYLPWNTGAGEPDDTMGGQDCVSAQMANPLIQTDKCGDTLPAVCECEP